MDLRKRVGNLVAANRRRMGLTQHQLSDLCGLSHDMVSRIETGKTGLRFPTLEKLAATFSIDPSELFIVPMPGRDMRRPLLDLTSKLSGLSDSDLVWVSDLLTSALKARR